MLTAGTAIPVLGYLDTSHLSHLFKPLTFSPAMESCGFLLSHHLAGDAEGLYLKSIPRVESTPLST